LRRLVKLVIINKIFYLKSKALKFHADRTRISILFAKVN